MTRTGARVVVAAGVLIAIAGLITGTLTLANAGATGDSPSRGMLAAAAMAAGGFALVYGAVRRLAVIPIRAEPEAGSVERQKLGAVSEAEKTAATVAVAADEGTDESGGDAQADEHIALAPGAEPNPGEMSHIPGSFEAHEGSRLPEATRWVVVALLAFLAMACIAQGISEWSEGQPLRLVAGIGLAVAVALYVTRETVTASGPEEAPELSAETTAPLVNAN